MSTECYGEFVSVQDDEIQELITIQKEKKSCIKKRAKDLSLVSCVPK